jgi:hypothetical protein
MLRETTPAHKGLAPSGKTLVVDNFLKRLQQACAAYAGRIPGLLAGHYVPLKVLFIRHRLYLYNFVSYKS